MKIKLSEDRQGIVNAETGQSVPYSYDYDAHREHGGFEEAEAVAPMGFTFAGADLCKCGTIIIDEDV